MPRQESTSNIGQHMLEKKMEYENDMEREIIKNDNAHSFDNISVEKASFNYLLFDFLKRYGIGIALLLGVIITLFIMN